MNVSYVTMQFPAPSETFASNDILALSRQGVRIAVHGMLTRHRAAATLTSERGLQGIEVTHNSAARTASGLLASLMRPRLLTGTVGWLLRHTWRRPGHLIRSLVLLPRAFGVLREIETRRPDIVHLYWGHYPSIVGYLVQRSLPSVSVSISLVAYDLEMNFGPSGPVARDAAMVRTLARVNVQDIASRTGVPAERIEVIFDGIDLERIDAVRSREQKVPKRVVAAGRLIRSKGMHDVLAAFARVRERWPEASLRILGDGPELPKLRALGEKLGVSDSVRFLGHASHERVMEELAKAEVLMLLSTKSSERLPNVVKEGMASRAWCITTPTPGMEELLQHGRTGFVVPMSDAAAAAAVLEDLFAARYPEEILDRAYAHVKQNFDLRATSSRYVRAWRVASGAAAPVRERPPGAIATTRAVGTR